MVRRILSAVAIFCSLFAIEFMIYVVLYFSFHLDWVAIRFLQQYPWTIRIPVLAGIVTTLIAFIISNSHNKYVHLGIGCNLIFLAVFFEHRLFHTFAFYPLYLFWKEVFTTAFNTIGTFFKTVGKGIVQIGIVIGEKTGEIKNAIVQAVSAFFAAIFQNT